MWWAQRVRLRKLQGWLVDGALALLLLGANLWMLWILADPPSPFVGLPWFLWMLANPPAPLTNLPFSAPNPAAVALVATDTLPIALRRRYPRAVLGIVTVAAVGIRLESLPVIEFGTLVALFTVAARCRRRDSFLALGLVAAVMTVLPLWQHQRRLSPLSLVPLVGYVAAWSLGDREQAHRTVAVELERGAQRDRERENQARLAIAEERARIARDLHDVVAHSVSVMVVHAGAARRMLASNTRRAEEALTQVEATGRQNLIELRQLLGVLRDDGQGPKLAPQPRLAYLDDLVEQFCVTGLPVQVEITGQPQPLTPSADLSAYRIVQEALTNALKHAHPSTVKVTLRYTEHDLQVEVVDDGRGATADGWRPGRGVGHGLVGMRERAALLGGQLDAGPRPGGGFRVRAILPLES